jgi:glycosyltransferase involved in cell wall biosynthesis
VQKRLAWTLFDRSDLERAACLHAISGSEVQAMRRLGLRNPIALIPNGITLKDYGCLPSRGVFEEAFPQAKGRKVLLFLSRVHPKKGLLHLVQAWRRLASHHPDWLLIIAGPDEGGHRRVVEQAIHASGMAQSAMLTGALQGELKLAALAAAEALVLPSFSEGFPIVLLEALACRVPLLATRHCNFPEAMHAGAGIEIVSPTAPAAEGALREMLSLSQRERREMGRKGYALLEREHTWEVIARKTSQLYSWLLGGGSRPEFVYTI